MLGDVAISCQSSSSIWQKALKVSGLTGSPLQKRSQLPIEMGKESVDAQRMSGSKILLAAINHLSLFFDHPRSRMAWLISWILFAATLRLAIIMIAPKIVKQYLGSLFVPETVT